jgi:hypothetical protein
MFLEMWLDVDGTPLDYDSANGLGTVRASVEGDFPIDRVDRIVVCAMYESYFGRPS